jgi:chemotaxis protein MotB
MPKRMLMMLTVLCFSLPMWGCVSMGTFENKEKEATDLTKNLQELQQKQADLSRENADLKAQVAKLTGDLEDVCLVRDRLVESTKGLEGSLKSTADEKNQKIIELMQRINDLEKENARMKDDIANIREAKEAEVKKVSSTLEEMTERMKEQIAKGDLTIRELRGKLTVDMKASVLFDSGKADVKPEGIEVLKKMTDTFKTLKGKVIRIEGHTDNKPITGSLASKYPTNWELSAARAINVARFLAAQGVDPHILSAVAYGEFQPKPEANNATEEGRASNRRIEIILVPKD